MGIEVIGGGLLTLIAGLAVLWKHLASNAPLVSIDNRKTIIMNIGDHNSSLNSTNDDKPEKPPRLPLSKN